MEAVLDGLTRGLDLSVLDVGMPGASCWRGGAPDPRRGRLPAAERRPRRRAARQLARRAQPLAAGDRPQDPAGPEARPGRALDALPHHPGPASRPAAARGPGLLSRPTTPARARSCCAAAVRCCSATAPRSRPGRRTAGGDPRPRVEQNHSGSKINWRGGPPAGSPTWSCWRPRSRKTAAAPASTPPESGWRAEAGQGRKLAEALAERLAAIEPRPLDDPEAAPRRLPEPPAGARASPRGSTASSRSPEPSTSPPRREPPGRRPRPDRRSRRLHLPAPYPDLVPGPRAPARRRELLFPFATVVEVPQAEIAEPHRPDPGRHRAHRGRGASPARCSPARTIDRLNLGRDPHLPRLLGPAPRGQPLRAPLPPPRAPGGGVTRSDPGDRERRPWPRPAAASADLADDLDRRARRHPPPLRPRNASPASASSRATSAPRRVLVVTDPGVRAAGHAGRALAALEAAGIAAGVVPTA